MDICNSYYSDEDCYHFESNDSDSYDEEYDTANYDMHSNGFEKKRIQRDIENKEKNIIDLELYNKSTYFSKLKSHSLRVGSIRERVYHCKKVLAAIVDTDYKVILYTFNHVSDEFSSPTLLAAMCLHHISSLSYTEKLNISNILNNLTEYIERNTTKAMHVDYLDLFFRNLDPERCFDLISRIWHFYLDIENALKFSFCKKIIESENPRNVRFLCANIKKLAYLWKTDHSNRQKASLLLSLLHYAVMSDQIEDVKYIKSIIATHMDCPQLVEAFTIYKEKCSTTKLLSWSKLIYTLDDILEADPKRKLWLLCLHFGVLLELKHFEEFKATVIHYRQFFLSHLCNFDVFLNFIMNEAIHKHSLFTVLLYLLYFCITTNQYVSEAHVLSKIYVFSFKGTDIPKSFIEMFFSLLPQFHDVNTQHTLVFTEVLLQIWEDKLDLKMKLIYAYGAYLWKSKCFELHGNFFRYHFQCPLPTVFLNRSEYATIAELEHFLFVLHHITKLNEITCLNLVKSKNAFRVSFRKYVSHCDESQILYVPGSIEKIGIIWESDQMFAVHAILIYGKEIINRGYFERYEQVVIRHQSLLMSELTKPYNILDITVIYSNKFLLLTFINLLQHYTTFNQCTKMKRLRSAVLFSFEFQMEDIFRDYINACDKKQFISNSLSLQYILRGIRNSHEKLQCLVIFWKKISELGCTDQFKDFIVDQKYFILSMTGSSLDLQFKHKTEYCVLLFHLLRQFIMSNNNRDIDLTLNAINNLKHNNLDEIKDSQRSNPNEIEMEERKVFKSSFSRFYRIDEVLNGNLEFHEYVRAVMDSYRDSCLDVFDRPKDSVLKIFTYYLQNLTTIKEEKGIIEFISGVGDRLEIGRYPRNISCEILSLILDVVYSILVLKHKEDQAKLATFLLHLNYKCPSNLVKKVTVEAGKILQWRTLTPENITTEENMVIYKCFCIMRQTKKTNRLKEINLEEYTSFFDFIEMIDQEEQRQWIIKQTILLLVFLLLITSITSDGHHRSAKLKKYLSLKYAYDDLVLYLLWCSGDVEINPGPTFSKIRPIHASEKERKWTCEVCSVLVKLLKGMPPTSKPKSLWKEKPTWWPQNEPFFDPYNRTKVQNDDLLSYDRLLKCLVICCDEKKICIPEAYRFEINLLTNNNKTLLFETYIFRKEKHNLCEALSNLSMCKDREKINQETMNCGITLNFDITQTSQNLTKTKRKGEIITHTRRDLAVILCKIIKGLIITDKCDGIWKTSPSKWPSDEPFYSPHNGKKKQGVCPDNELVDNLVKYCESNLVVIPSQFQGMVTAWKKGHMDELITIHTIYANVAKLEHSLQYLQIEGILPKPDILDFLKDNGLTLDTDTWKLNDRTKDGNHTAGRKHVERLVGNPSTPEDTASMKSSSCNERNTELQNLDISQQRAELYQNTLLPSTATSKTVDAEPFSLESSSRRKKQPKLGRSEEHNSQKRKSNTETFDGEEHEETKKQKMNNCLSEILPSTQEEEDKLKQQLNEPVPPMSEASKKCCPPDFDNILNRLLNCKDLENSINVDVY